MIKWKSANGIEWEPSWESVDKLSCLDKVKEFLKKRNQNRLCVATDYGSELNGYNFPEQPGIVYYKRYCNSQKHLLTILDNLFYEAI